MARPLNVRGTRTAVCGFNWTAERAWDLSRRRAPSIAHDAIRVAPFDRDALLSRLRELGTRVLPAPDEPDVLRFADGNGIVVELRVASS
jgi:hypothetical protein